jgi:hypothetical protein
VDHALGPKSTRRDMRCGVAFALVPGRDFAPRSGTGAHARHWSLTRPLAPPASTNGIGLLGQNGMQEHRELAGDRYCGLRTPLLLRMRMPHIFSVDHFCTRNRTTRAASYR